MLKDDIDEVNGHILRIKQTYIDALSMIKQNPDIKENGGSFTINVSNLSTDFVLCPFYYNFIEQADEIIGVVKEKSLVQIEKYIDYIITNGRTPNGDKIHPEVIKELERIFYDNR